jgi:phosphoribosylaminoimidazole carboxylase PurE protein
MSQKKIVSIVMGSDSDLPVVGEATKILDEFGVTYEMKVLSAHRTPEEVRRYARKLEERGVKIVIAFAGGAAHLAGVLASHTVLPVIGVPVETKSLKGLDSLLSTVQMPGGVPVATVAIGKAGAKNAALLATQILAIGDAKLTGKLVTFKKDMAQVVKRKNNNLGLRTR